MNENGEFNFEELRIDEKEKGLPVRFSATIS